MAVSYPRFTLAGVDLNDPSGRWELVEGTDSLPVFPGRNMTKLEIPGRPGYTAAAYMPQQSSVITLTMRFNAVAGAAHTFPSTIAAQHKAIRDNMTLFFHGTATARSGYLGQIELRNYASATDWRCALGFIASSATPSWSNKHSYADVTFLFENPTGSWLAGGYSVVTGNLVGGGRSKDLKMPTGSAPTWNNYVAFKGPYSWDAKSGSPSAGATNSHGLGFRLGIVGGSTISISSTQWVIVDTNTGKAGVVTGSNADGTQPRTWNITYNKDGWVRTVGRPIGPVLHILPESGDYGTGIARVWRPNAGRVAVRTRRRYY